MLRPLGVTFTPGVTYDRIAPRHCIYFQPVQQKSTTKVWPSFQPAVSHRNQRADNASWAQIVNPAPATDAQWLPPITCESGFAVCGISTRVDFSGANFTIANASNSASDDSGVSGVTLRCCPRKTGRLGGCYY